MCSCEVGPLRFSALARYLLRCVTTQRLISGSKAVNSMGSRCFPGLVVLSKFLPVVKTCFPVNICISVMSCLGKV